MPGAPIKIGYSLSLTGGLAANGQTARLAHQIWQDDVSAFPGVSLISGPPDALAPLRGLRATLFVDSLADTEKLLEETGWTKVGSLGSDSSLLSRDPDGNLLEFVERTTP